MKCWFSGNKLTKSEIQWCSKQLFKEGSCNQSPLTLTRCVQVQSALTIYLEFFKKINAHKKLTCLRTRCSRPMPRTKPGIFEVEAKARPLRGQDQGHTNLSLSWPQGRSPRGSRPHLTQSSCPLCWCSNQKPWNCYLNAYNVMPSLFLTLPPTCNWFNCYLQINKGRPVVPVTLLFPLLQM